jgi:hypothetical protein
MSFVKKIVFSLISIAFGVLVVVIGAEIILRFLPYNSGLRVQPVNASNPILHFEPNRTATWSQGWDFEMVNRDVRTNNAGFRNDRDYDPALKTPLFAVIGDSNIEALMVPFAETTPARLADAVKDKGRVYSFAASGAGFGTHLAWARHARDVYKPNGFMVLVISNDFQEALYKYEHAPAFHYLKDRPDGGFDLVREDYEPDLLRRTLRRSALFMYMALNVRLYATASRLFRGQPAGRYVANMPAEQPDNRIADMKKGVDFYLDQFAQYAGVDRSRVVFVVDALRPHIYDPAQLAETKGSMARVMNEYFIEQAKARGYEVIDMTPIFLAQYTKDRRKFEFPLNYHLDGHGHDMVSKAVANSNAFQSSFKAQ